MKRVLIFSLAYYPHVGGAEVAVKEITDRLTDFEFHMVTLRFSKNDAAEEKVGNVMVHRIGSGASYLSKILFIPSAAAFAIKLNRKIKFDLLWAMMLYMTFPIVLMRMRGVRLPYALTLQEGDPYEHVFERWFIKPFSPLLKTGFLRASVVQTISTYLALWAKRNHYSGPIEVIPNGYIDPRGNSDLNWFLQNIDINRKVFWKGKGIPENDIILLTTSRLVHKNAIDVVIRALPMLPNNVRFVVLGDGIERQTLKKLAEDLKVIDRVHFLGEIPNTRLMLYLHAADVFVRPSRSEGMGNSFIEAMAAELPVIGTQEGGIADFLFDPERNPDKPPTGFAVDKDNPGQIAVTVEKILNNKVKTAEVKKNAKALALANYDWDSIAKRMQEKVFGKILI